jgi:mRNA interferase MazF
MSFSRGDVLIALFPHADGSPPKPRPVVVVQSDVYNAKIKNYVVAAITSNLTHAADPASLLIDVTTLDGQKTGLRQNSLVSCLNLATIHESLVAKRIGQLSPALMQKVDECLKVALAIP